MALQAVHFTGQSRAHDPLNALLQHGGAAAAELEHAACFFKRAAEGSGHVFDVRSSGAVTPLSFDLGDEPITDVVRDDTTNDLYASTDFGVMELANGTTSWTLAAPGMPNVEVAGLTIVPEKRKLFAASHGLGAWSLNLP